MHLDKIVSSYILNYREAARNEARYFEDQRSLSAAIREATLTCLMPSGKKHLTNGAFRGPRWKKENDACRQHQNE